MTRDANDEMESINGDLTQRVSVDTATMAWSPSPSGTVWRKRVHLVGQPESGQVTSIVRYEPNSSFPAHDHPDGEEILVLEGIFSDEQGDWPAGTFLLNPEGFRHAPFSAGGCVIFVKLRQYPGKGRKQLALSTADMQWQATAEANVEIKPLYAQDGFDDTMRLERWARGTVRGEIRCPYGAEIFVLDGALEDAGRRFARWSWLRLPAGAAFAPASPAGCTLYIKEGGLRYLNSA